MDSRAAHLLFRLMAPEMESPLRCRSFGRVTSLEGAGIRSVHEVLGIGCGTWFFTIRAAELVGGEGHVCTMDAHALAIEQVMRRTEDAGATNVKANQARCDRGWTGRWLHRPGSAPWRDPITRRTTGRARA